MDIQIKRAYEKPGADDGLRVLVDRLWPRGISKDKARIDFWPRELAPSNELRRWYGHEPGKWAEFKDRYVAELADKQELVRELLARIGQGRATFVYSSKEQHINNAVALKEYLLSLRKAGPDT